MTDTRTTRKPATPLHPMTEFLSNMTTSPKRRSTPLKIAGEVQMKVLSHDMNILRRDNERLRADRARLVAALREVIRNQPDISTKYRALLRELGESE